MAFCINILYFREIMETKDTRLHRKYPNLDLMKIEYTVNIKTQMHRIKCVNSSFKVYNLSPNVKAGVINRIF